MKKDPISKLHKCDYFGALTRLSRKANRFLKALGYGTVIR